MDHKQIINHRQLAWLTSSIITSGGILSLQNVLIQETKMDAWFCYLTPMLYIFVVASFFAALHQLFPTKNIFEISIQLLGRTGGTLVNLILMLHFWMIVVRDVSSFSQFSSTILLINTPLSFLILLPCLLLMYYGKSSIEIIARVNDLFYPLFVVSILMMPLLLTNEISVRMLHPVLTTLPVQLGNGSVLAIGGAGDIFVIGAFMHSVLNSNQVRSSIRFGIMVGGLLLTILSLLEILVLGPHMPGNFLYPTYNLVQMIHVTEFLDRLDLIMLTIWLPTIACKIIAIYMALLMGFSSLVQEQDYTLFNKPVALFIAISTIMAFKSSTELYAFANFSSPIIVLAYQPLVMALLYLKARYHKKNKDHSAQDNSSSSLAAMPNQQDNQQKQTGKRQIPYPAWVRVGNMLLLAAAAFIIVGLLFSKYVPLIGNISAAGYLTCLILTICSTRMEINKLNQQSN